MSEQTLTLSPRQATVFAEKLAAFNAARITLGEYFGAICDAHDLSRDTEFVSIADTGQLVVRVSDG